MVACFKRDSNVTKNGWKTAQSNPSWYAIAVLSFIVFIATTTDDAGADLRSQGVNTDTRSGGGQQQEYRLISAQEEDP